MNERLVRERVLVVDADDQVRGILERTLVGEGYRCEATGDVGAARAQLEKAPFDLVVCDLNLPDEAGMRLVEEVAGELEGTAALTICGVEETALGQKAIGLGAYGYVIKPFTVNEALTAVLGALRHRRGKDATSRATSPEEAIHRLSMAIESRDPATALHVSHMSDYCGRTACELDLPAERCELIRAAAPMHDVGKVAVSDAILQKPGPLTPEERAEMQFHAEVGYRFLAGSPSPLLQTAASIAWTHHERFDGGGYPRRLAGREIPIEGRIAAVADVFDALTRDRIYRRRVPLAEAFTIMSEGSGTQFDPEVLAAFLRATGAMERSVIPLR